MKKYAQWLAIGQGSLWLILILSFALRFQTPAPYNNLSNRIFESIPLLIPGILILLGGLSFKKFPLLGSWLVFIPVSIWCLELILRFNALLNFVGQTLGIQDLYSSPSFSRTPNWKITLEFVVGVGLLALPGIASYFMVMFDFFKTKQLLQKNWAVQLGVIQGLIWLANGLIFFIILAPLGDWSEAAAIILVLPGFSIAGYILIRGGLLMENHPLSGGLILLIPLLALLALPTTLYHNSLWWENTLTVAWFGILIIPGVIACLVGNLELFKRFKRPLHRNGSLS